MFRVLNIDQLASPQEINQRCSAINSIRVITSPFITASRKTIRVVIPKVGGTGGPSESNK